MRAKGIRRHDCRSNKTVEKLPRILLFKALDVKEQVIAQDTHFRYISVYGWHFCSGISRLAES